MTRPGLWIGLVVAVSVVALWAVVGTQEALPELTRGAEDWSGDFRAYYLPNAELAAERIRSGALPLWNPHQGAGGPFLATLQPGVLYPGNWLHLVLPAQPAFLVTIALHLVLAVLLGAALARALGASDLGAAAAGLAYATSFQLVGSLWTPPLIYTAAWMPGVVWAVDRILDRPTPRRAVTLGVFATLPALAGWPYTVALTALAASGYALPLLVARVARERVVPWRPLLAFGAAALLAGALAAPQLLPAAELLPRSCRALGSIIEEQAIFVPRPHDPRVFFRTTLELGFNDGVPGYAALLLAPLALVLSGRNRGKVASLLAVGIVGLAASFPDWTPVYGWLRELPVLGDFRFPYRYRLITTLSLAMAAGVGVTRLEVRAARLPWGTRAGWAVGALAIAAVFALGSVPTMRSISPFARSVPPPMSLGDELAAEGIELQPNGLERIYWTDRSHKLRSRGDEFAIYDMEPLTLARTAELLTYFETGRPRTLLTLKPALEPAKPHEDWVAAPFFGWLELPATSERAAILDLFSVGTIVSEAPPVWLASRYERISPPGSRWSVFRNPHALPRAYRVGRARPEPEALPRALALLTARRFDPGRVALVDHPPPALLPVAGRPAVLDDGTVTIESYEPERISMRTVGSRAALVVLTDAFYPGWRATVDGENTPILRANLNFRGIAVPAGEHVIEMRYAPSSLRLGFALASIGAAGAALAWRRGGGDRQTMRDVRSPQ